MEKTLKVLLDWQESLRQSKQRFWIGNLLDTLDTIMTKTGYTRVYAKQQLRSLFILGYIEIFRRPNIEEIPMMSILRICTKPKLNQIDLDDEHRTLENLLALIPEDQIFHSYLEVPKDEISQVDAYCNILYHGIYEYQEEISEKSTTPKNRHKKNEIHDLVSGTTYKGMYQMSQDTGIQLSYIKACLDNNPRPILLHDGIEYKLYKNDEIADNIIYEGVMEYNKYQKNGDPLFYAYRYKNYALTHPERRVGEALTGQVFASPTSAGKAFKITGAKVKSALKDGKEIIKADGTRCLFYFMEEDPTKKVWIHFSCGKRKKD